MEIVEVDQSPVLAVELTTQFKFVPRAELPKEVIAKLHRSVQGLLVTRRLAAEYAMIKKDEGPSRGNSH